MNDDDRDNEQPRQQTKPRKGRPRAIPIPTREDVLRDLQKVAKPSRAKRESRPEDEG